MFADRGRQVTCTGLRRWNAEGASTHFAQARRLPLVDFGKPVGPHAKPEQQMQQPRTIASALRPANRRDDVMSGGSPMQLGDAVARRHEINQHGLSFTCSIVTRCVVIRRLDTGEGCQDFD
jgi:hypothetical protein